MYLTVFRETFDEAPHLGTESASAWNIASVLVWGDHHGSQPFSNLTHIFNSIYTYIFNPVQQQKMELTKTMKYVITLGSKGKKCSWKCYILKSSCLFILIQLLTFLAFFLPVSQDFTVCAINKMKWKLKLVSTFVLFPYFSNANA